MTFFISKKKGIGTIPRYTKCEKLPYTKKIIQYLMKMEGNGINRSEKKTKAVCVFLEGRQRYVWRTDVLTKKEYDEIREEEKRKFSRVFGKKPKRVMGQG